MQNQESYRNSQNYRTYSVGDYKPVDSNKTNFIGRLGTMVRVWAVTIGLVLVVQMACKWISFTSWTDYITTWGGTGVNDDPEFVNNWRLWNDNPYEISATSPAIDAGTDMTYILQAFEYLPQV